MPKQMQGPGVSSKTWYLIRFENGQLLDTYAEDAHDLAEVIKAYARPLVGKDDFLVEVDLDKGTGSLDGNGLTFTIEERDKPTPPVSPEHDKLREVKAQSQACGEFLEWLSDTKKLVLCFFDDESDQYQPAHPGLTRLLAEFFSIDQDKLESEKRAMLDYLGKLNEWNDNRTKGAADA